MTAHICLYLRTNTVELLSDNLYFCIRALGKLCVLITGEPKIICPDPLF